MSATSQGEILIDHVSPGGALATAARGTLVMSALQGLREHDVLAAFLGELPELLHTELLGASPLSWVPIQHLLEMCLAVDRLRLTDRQLAELGGVAGGSIGATILSTILRTAGATPWAVLSSLDRLWDRFYMGGGICVVRVGPKDAFVELSGLPHAVSRYCRTSTLAFFQALAGKVAKSIYAAPARPRTPVPTTFAFSLSWV